MNAKQAKSLAENSLYKKITSQIDASARDGRLSTYMFPHTEGVDRKKYEPIYDVIVSRLMEAGYDAKIEEEGVYVTLAISWKDA